jgi:hypothetical protein
MAARVDTDRSSARDATRSVSGSDALAESEAINCVPCLPVQALGEGSRNREMPLAHGGVGTGLACVRVRVRESVGGPECCAVGAPLPDYRVAGVPRNFAQVALAKP